MKDTIAHLRELLSKATPGHWVFEAMLQTPGHGFIDAHKDRHAQSVVKNDRDVDEVAIRLEDGLLIVAAVNALPDILARLEKLERYAALISESGTAVMYGRAMTPDEVELCSSMRMEALKL